MERRCPWALGIIFVLILCGCVKQQSTASFSDHLKEVDLEKSYTINAYTSYASSGGGTSTTKTREINSTELKAVVDEIKDMNVAGSFETGNRSCFYSGGGPGPDYFVCFAGNEIADYVKTDGPSYSQWNAAGYEYDYGRSTLIESIKDLKGCKNDSDCTLEYFGVCDPTGICKNADRGCDTGCRTAINVKYNFIWDFVPLVEDQCITDKCNHEQNKYFSKSCVNNVCESVIVGNS